MGKVSWVKGFRESVVEGHRWRGRQQSTWDEVVPVLKCDLAQDIIKWKLSKMCMHVCACACTCVCVCVCACECSVRIRLCVRVLMNAS